MKQYTTYCTPEQTRKALELGAPIEYASINEIRLERYISVNNEEYALPTAEEMIVWLEGQDGIEDITVCKTGMWIWGKNHTLIDGGPNYSSRQESSLAAIDAALNCLISKK